MNTRLCALILIAGSIITASCKQSGKSDGDLTADSINLGEIKPLVHEYDSIGEGLPIFYNMYLSVEMSSLFQSSGATFKEGLLNSPDKISDYVTSSKKALNLGVYAVDLSYSRVGGQLETAGIYFNAMQKLAEELGIPADYFKNTAERFDRNINEKDSLIKIANEVYMASDNYLRENERYAASAQMIIGGWVEAIYIASDIASTTRDIEIIERLAEQKSSLENVISMLNDYAGDVAINQLLKKLKALQPVFNSFVVDVDPAFNPASAEGKKSLDAFVLKAKEVKTQIAKIRAEIIS